MSVGEGPLRPGGKECALLQSTQVWVYDSQHLEAPGGFRCFLGQRVVCRSCQTENAKGKGGARSRGVERETVENAIFDTFFYD